MYKYCVYETYINSEVRLYNLSEDSGTADVVIGLGKIDYEGIPESKRGFYYSEDFVCFSTNEGAYSIKKGNEIVVEPCEEANENMVAATIIGWCFAFLFTQRGYSAIHSTGLSVFGNGIIVSGVSGAGKSTVALELMRRGHKYLVDDCAMINPDLGMKVIPGYPMQKVCRDRISSVDKELLYYIGEERDKFAYLNKTEFCTGAVPLFAIIILDKYDGDEVIFEEITGIDKFMTVLSSLFLAEIYSFKGIPEGDKRRSLEIAGKAKIFKITRPNNGDSVAAIGDVIEKIAREY